MNATNEQAATNPAPAAGPRPGDSAPQPLRRPSEGRMLAGVAAGVARSLGIDPVIVRVAFAVLALAGGAGVPLYLAGWLLIPDAESGLSLAAQLIYSASADR